MRFDTAEQYALLFMSEAGVLIADIRALILGESSTGAEVAGLFEELRSTDTNMKVQGWHRMHVRLM